MARRTMTTDDKPESVARHHATVCYEDCLCEHGSGCKLEAECGVHPQPVEQQPALAKYQPCGCVICTCEHETQCQGCGAKHCGTHPIGQLYKQPAPDVDGLVDALEEIAKWTERWTAPDHPIATVARKALATYRKQQENDHD